MVVDTHPHCVVRFFTFPLLRPHPRGRNHFWGEARMHLYRVGQATDGALMVSVDDLTVAVMELSQRYIDHGWPLIGYAVAHVADHLDGITMDGAIVIPDSAADLTPPPQPTAERWWRVRRNL